MLAKLLIPIELRSNNMNNLCGCYVCHVAVIRCEMNESINLSLRRRRPHVFSQFIFCKLIGKNMHSLTAQ